MTEDHAYTEKAKPAFTGVRDTVNDLPLKNLLVKLRKQVADKNEVPPYTVFQENSINDMTLKYPITIEEMINIHGVGEGKAKKYGPIFINLIKKYVEDNNIARPDDIGGKKYWGKFWIKIIYDPKCRSKITPRRYCLCKRNEYDRVYP